MSPSKQEKAEKVKVKRKVPKVQVSIKHQDNKKTSANKKLLKGVLKLNQLLCRNILSKEYGMVW